MNCHITVINASSDLNALLLKTQKFNYVFNTLDLPDFYDEWESLFLDHVDGDEKSYIHCEQLIA